MDVAKVFVSIARLRKQGFSIDDPLKVPGFDNPSIATIADPDGNTFNLLFGQ